MAPSSVASDDSGNDVRAINYCAGATGVIDLITQDSFIVDIDAIQAHGIGAVDIAKLKANGYYTIASVHSATRRNLLKIKGFSEIKVDKVKEAITKCQVPTLYRPCVLRDSTDTSCSLRAVAFRPLMSSVSSESAFSRSRPVASNSTPYSEGVCMPHSICSTSVTDTTQWLSDHEYQRGLRRVSLREDSTLAHHVGHCAAAERYGRC